MKELRRQLRLLKTEVSKLEKIIEEIGTPALSETAEEIKDRRLTLKRLRKKVGTIQ